MHPLRIALQQQQRLFREGLRLLLSREEDIDVVAAVATGDELARYCEGDPPDVALIEIDSTGREAASVLRRIQHTRRVGLRVIGVYSCFTAEAAAAVRLPAMVHRCEGVDPLLRAIRGERSVASVRISPTALRAHPRRSLTERETDVLARIGAGRTTQRISADLNISRKTVENHKQRIFGKLEVRNQAQAVSVAVRGGLLTVERVLELAEAD